MESKIEIYKTSAGTEINVKLEEDTIWLDALAIADLFGVNRPAIVKHVGNIYKSEELEKDSTCSILEQVAADGKKRKMNFYNLDMILSVGYRVNSSQATKFRQWATQRLKDYLVEGYAINEKRLGQKNQQVENLITGLRIVSRARESFIFECPDQLHGRPPGHGEEGGADGQSFKNISSFIIELILFLCKSFDYDLQREVSKSNRAFY